MSSRIVVKIGSSSLASVEGALNREAIIFFAREMASLKAAGHEVLLVTSGAVAAGFREIGYDARPRLLHEKQAAAAVGQALLMQAYQQAFAAHGIVTAQLLLTRTDFCSRKRMNNAGMTVEELLKQGVIPIVNENDTVSVDELKFGDNDTLSALVANLVKARHLLILTDMDGLYSGDPRKYPDAVRYSHVTEITEEIYTNAGGAGSSLGTGGMRSKIDAAKIATRGGVPVFIGQVTAHGDLQNAVDGQGRGTYFDTKLSSLSMKKQWLGFMSTPLGSITVDAGAETALIHGGHSLLPVGVKHVVGHFHAGDVVEVLNTDAVVLGRGVINYDDEQLRQVCGMSSSDVYQKIDSIHRLEVVHRDEWITLK
ncbi:glutamate 5-kinase [Paenibacillus macquariensis]|uniref:Glutamate 5-kinase n=1 Tax=Paenibacillus macquariensis TaxID=948756 RepID=A0ABY1JJ77_9BACL|nr:glutamate 5-kinase [Paenibacillus macquariensis]MEC0089657.1 glutamate 5-kinase [Paenibacillus macquariensis]OAB30860.1 glutamate 5-kinase [Paenibacillus macquariensis subsp. macquariensis]SIQ28151.1 glutamate 5-kinase [Paenibacillus macquariensis]